MHKLQCETCKHIIEVDRKTWITFRRSLKDLPQPFNSGTLNILDKISNCCDNPNYWIM